MPPNLVASSSKPEAAPRTVVRPHADTIAEIPAYLLPEDTVAPPEGRYQTKPSRFDPALAVSSFLSGVFVLFTSLAEDCQSTHTVDLA